MVDEEILTFPRAIDDELARSVAEGEVLPLHLLGRSALVLGFGVRLMTKDVNVVHVHDSGLLDRAVALFGAGRTRPPDTDSISRPSRPACRPCPSATRDAVARSPGLGFSSLPTSFGRERTRKQRIPPTSSAGNCLP